jgi:2-amino-4-hydroxy-6-hydroxymethyldihydropteridine diphosphokinase
MKTVYLSLGSNQGDRFSLLQTAISEIQKRIGKITVVSPIYETEPIGFESDELFLNACCAVKTNKTPYEILQIINTIESESGRIRNNQNGYSSRPLDIDIILIEDLILDSEELRIPHPRFRERLFVLKPLSDLAENLLDPESEFTIYHLLKTCPDKSVLNKYELSLFI